MGERTLYQFAHSHFSEKARWALDFKGLAFDRVNLTRGPHGRQLRKLGGEASTVPLLVDGDAVIQDSTAIIDYLELTYPQHSLDLGEDDSEARKLEEKFDDALGFHGRRFVYSVLIDHPDVLKLVFLQGKGRLMRLLFPLLFGAMKPKMIESLRLGPGATEESSAEVWKMIELIDERLADGSKYLVGNSFTRADLTAAALLSIITWPAEHEFEFPPADLLPTALREFRERAAATLAYPWALQLYCDHRARDRAAG